MWTLFLSVRKIKPNWQISNLCWLFFLVFLISIYSFCNLCNCHTHSHNLLCLCWLSNFLFSHLPQTLFSNSYTRKKMRNIYYFILFSLIIQLCLIQTIVLHMENLLFFLIWRSILCDTIFTRSLRNKTQKTI